MDLDGWPFKGSGYGKNTHRGLEYSFNIHDIYVNSKCWRSALSYSIISNAFKTLTFQFLILSSEKIHLGWMYRMYLNDSRVHSFISQDDKEFYWLEYRNEIFWENCWARNAVLEYTPVSITVCTFIKYNKWPCLLLHWYTIIHLFSYFTLTLSDRVIVFFWVSTFKTF